MASSGTSDISYCFNQVSSIDGLKSLIHSRLDELGFRSRCDLALSRLKNELKLEDKKSGEITKKFDEGASVLEGLMMDLHAFGDVESDNDDDMKSIPSISVASDDDDEIMVVDSNASSFTGATSNAVSSRPFQSLQQSVRLGAGQNSPLTSGQSLILVNEGGQQIRAVVTSMNPMNNNPTLRFDGGPGQAPILSPLAHQATPRAMTVLNQPSPKPPELAAGMKLYAKKFNDIWYKGALIEIQSRERPFSERKYKIKFDGKGMKVIGSKSIAYTDHPKDTLLVGSRVIAMYKDDEHSMQSFYAGIIAEPPSLRNNNRYLVFFDDGYAQYSVANHLHQVCDQSKQVWEDIHPDSQEFIKGYLQQYPERPMVRLHPGQTIKTEWKGNWWVAKVQEVDASLVKMYFESDKRVEWIYRGSTRLEPLYTELANAEASKQMGKGRRRGNLNPKGSKKPFVEYTRCLEEPVPKKPTLSNQTFDHTLRANNGSLDHTIDHQSLDAQRPVKAVAKKSTSKPQVVPMHVEPPKQPMCEDSQSSSAHSTRTDRRLASNRGNDATDPGLEGPLGAFVEIDRDQFVRRESLHKTRMPLCCGLTCLRDLNDDPAMYKLKNPLLIPLFYGWERQVTKQRNSLKRGICYRTPCGRLIRNLTEIDRYLLQTNSKLTIDLFCFDPVLRIDVEYIPVKTFCDIKDLSYGKENVPISCVNGIDRQYPDYVEYSNQRIPAKGVQLVLDPEFLVGCDCTDGCRDRSKCRCVQMTISATAWSSGGRDESAGYKQRRLNEPLLTGIFECNSKCRCDSRCHNRVVQHGLTLRLQVFKTEKRGWGLRCLDDIPAGGFICIYAGQLLTDEGANEDGQQYGDEYLAELDYIETVEKTKEGYESDVPPEDDDSSDDDQSTFDGAADQRDSDSTYSGERRLNKNRKKRRKRRKNKKLAEKGEKSSTKDEQAAKPKPWPDKAAGKTKSLREKTQDWLDKMPITISDDDLDDDNKEIDVSLDSDKPVETGKLDDAGKLEDTDEKKFDEKKLDEKKLDEKKLDEKKLDEKLEVMDSKGQDADDAKKLEIGKLEEKKDVVDAKAEQKDEKDLKETIDDATGPKAADNAKTNPVEKVDEELSLLVITDPISLNVDDVDLDSDDCDEAVVNKENTPAKLLEEPDEALKRTTRSQTSRFHNLPDPKSQKPIGVPKTKPQKTNERKHDGKGFVRTRHLFGEEYSYTMDAKSMGNLGRYLNHSCSPNAFVQSVFVDTHDLRFPWVAFFAFDYIRAGTELTWDYNYGVGSVPGKVLYCYCGSAECRGRLL